MSVQKEKEVREELFGKDKIIYHYCSLDALFGIITSKSLWLTALNSTNDSQELTAGKKILDEFLEIESEKNEDVRYQEFLSCLANEKVSKQVKKYRNNIKYYGLSCVTMKDSLTHWDRYGGNGTGVCIGINVALLEHHLAHNVGIFSTWLSNAQILYNSDEQRTYIKETFDSKFSSFPKDVLKELPGIYSIIYHSVLEHIKPLIKHRGFVDEQEYRIIFQEGEAEKEAEYYQATYEKFQDPKALENVSKSIIKCIKNLQLLKEDKKYYKIGENIRSLYALNLNTLWSDTLIQEIIIGPQCSQNKEELKGFLKQNGLYRTKIINSQIPIR